MIIGYLDPWGCFLEHGGIGIVLIGDRSAGVTAYGAVGSLASTFDLHCSTSEQNLTRL